MSNDNINTLRETLFDTLRGLQDPKVKLDVARAKAINATAQTIINSIKVEVDYARAVLQGAPRTHFVPSSLVAPSGHGDAEDAAEDATEDADADRVVARLTSHGKETVTPVAAGVIRRHVMR